MVLIGRKKRRKHKSVWQSSNIKSGTYWKAGRKYKYSAKRDAKIKAKHIGKQYKGKRAWRGDSRYSKKYKGWI